MVTLVVFPPLREETHDERGEAGRYSYSGYANEYLSRLLGLLPQGRERLVQAGLGLLCKPSLGGVHGCIVLLLHILTHSCERLVQGGLGLFRKLSLGGTQGYLVLLSLLLPRSGKGLTDGVARQLGQAVMLGDVLGEKLVLADDPWDELLVDPVPALPRSARAPLWRTALPLRLLLGFPVTLRPGFGWSGGYGLF